MREIEPIEQYGNFRSEARKIGVSAPLPLYQRENKMTEELKMFWMAIYVAAINSIGNTEVATSMADDAVEAYIERWSEKNDS